MFNSFGGGCCSWIIIIILILACCNCGGMDNRSGCNNGCC